MSKSAFTQLVIGLHPYLPQIVLVGGWAHRLFQYHPWGKPLEFEVLMTEDADLGVPIPLLSLPLDTPDIHTLLLQAGFHWSGREGGDLYSLGIEEGNFYVEFIAPLIGSATDRGGRPKAQARVGGINAEMLRYVDLLLKEPWQYALVPEHGFSWEKVKNPLRVANPVSYLMQKVLTVERRPQESKKAKDVLYIHDTLLIFGEGQAQI